MTTKRQKGERRISYGPFGSRGITFGNGPAFQFEDFGLSFTEVFGPQIPPKSGKQVEAYFYLHLEHFCLQLSFFPGSAERCLLDTLSTHFKGKTTPIVS